MIPFFNIARQNETLKKDLGEAIAKVITSGHYILGENVSGFEREFAAYVGTKFAIGVASGTDALHLALRACSVQAGDEVITSPFSFIAAAEVIAYTSATPVFVDIEPKSFNIDPSKIEEKITKKTKAILVVHLYGQACDIDPILKIAKRNDLKVIEDCAQATAAEYNSQKVGSFGDAGCFSFFPTKNLGCFGDGGMVVTSEEKIAEEIKVLRNHGCRKTYHHELIGYNSRLDELQAAILRVKLPFLEGWIEKRRGNALLYQEFLKDIEEIILPPELKNRKHTYNQFTIRTKNRDSLYDYLRKKEIGGMVYYPLSLHLQKAFTYLGYKKGDFPESEKAQAEVLSLPIFPELREKEIEEICLAIRTWEPRPKGWASS